MDEVIKCKKCGGNMAKTGKNPKDFSSKDDCLECFKCGHSIVQCSIQGSLDYNRAKQLQSSEAVK